MYNEMHNEMHKIQNTLMVNQIDGKSNVEEKLKWLKRLLGPTGEMREKAR